MALSIKNQEIIGEIDNLQDKLDGRIPIDRLELLVLVNSWGRNAYILTKNEIKDNNLEFCIDNCEPKECYNLSKLDVSQITNMDSIFEHSNYNGDIGNWDVSNVTSMFKMFAFNREFNSPLNNWDVSNVKSMVAMFSYTKLFNQPLNNWNTSNATDMKSMFNGAEKFNQVLSSWDVSNVKDMYAMFYGTKEFNQPLNKWNVSKVTDMNRMFDNAIAFNNIHSSNGVGLHNQALNDWDISKVTSMNSMFSETKLFNQNISNWCLDNVLDCQFMLDNAKAFLDKYNNSKPLPNYTDEIKEWFNLNRERMDMIDIKEEHGEEIDDFFLNLNTLNKSLNKT